MELSAYDLMLIYDVLTACAGDDNQTDWDDSDLSEVRTKIETGLKEMKLIGCEEVAK